MTTSQTVKTFFRDIGVSTVSLGQAYPSPLFSRVIVPVIATSRITVIRPAQSIPRLLSFSVFNPRSFSFE